MCCDCVLYNVTKDYIGVRKLLLEECKLKSVIGLSSGIFKKHQLYILLKVNK